MEFFLTAFLLGLVGSLHCAGMCGPLALALPGTHSAASRFVLGRLCYNLGRLLTYCLLGILFGLIGKSLLLAGVQRWVSIGLGAALLAGLAGAGVLRFSQPVTRFVAFLKQRMGSCLHSPGPRSLLTLGLFNGLLPCGLVYVAGAGAVATGSVGSSIAYMALFGLGTFPMLLAISLSGKLVPTSWRLHLRKAIPVSVFLLASLLILRGMSLGIPYLSPVLDSARPACCHH